MDSAADVGYYLSLALDSADHPHIAYFDTTNRHLKYASSTGSTWVTETVDSSNSVGYYASLVIDESDQPCIAYVDSPYQDVKYAKWNGVSWTIESAHFIYIGFMFHVGSLSVALDSAGNPHVSFYDTMYDGVFYGSSDGSSWDVAPMECDGAVGGDTSIAADSSGHPHIAYRDFAHQTIKYTSWDGANWVTETACSYTDWTGGPSLVLDGSANPHIAYHDAGSGVVKYAKRTGTSWATQAVAGTQDADQYVSLKLDHSGNPHIAYAKLLASACLCYTSWTGTAWSTQIVDTNGGDYCSLALDSHDRPHISYRSFAQKALKHADWNGSTWVVEIVATAGNYVQWTSIALDSKDRPHIAFWDSPGQHIKYAGWNGSSWTVQTVDTVLQGGMSNSIAVDSCDRPHIAYTDDENDALRYAYWDGSSWITQSVDSAYCVGTGCSLAMDNTGSPHISYSEYYACNLKYAHPSIAAPVVTDEGAFASCSRVTASWTSSPSIYWYEYALGESPTSFVVNWKSVTMATLAAENVALIPGKTYYWFVRGSDGGSWTEIGQSDGVMAVASSKLGDVKAGNAGPVLITDLAVTSTSSDYPGLWLTSTSRSGGVSVPGNWSVTRGSTVQMAGTLAWQDGVPVLTSPELKSNVTGSATTLVGLRNNSAANDPNESLSYAGANPVGMLVAVWGTVTAVDTAANVFYVDDGSKLADGMLMAGVPSVGLRITYRSGVLPPGPGTHLRVAGIRTVDKVTLSSPAVVNGRTRAIGETLYVPIIKVRDEADIHMFDSPIIRQSPAQSSAP